MGSSHRFRHWRFFECSIFFFCVCSEERATFYFSRWPLPSTVRHLAEEPVVYWISEGCGGSRCLPDGFWVVQRVSEHIMKCTIRDRLVVVIITRSTRHKRRGVGLVDRSDSPPGLDGGDISPPRGFPANITVRWHFPSGRWRFPPERITDRLTDASVFIHVCMYVCNRSWEICVHIMYTRCRRLWIKRHRYTLAFVCIFHRKGENATGFNILLYRYNCVRQTGNVIIKSCPSFDLTGR